MTNYLKNCLTGSITLLLILFSLNGYSDSEEIDFACAPDRCVELCTELIKKARHLMLQSEAAIIDGAQAKLELEMLLSSPNITSSPYQRDKRRWKIERKTKEAAEAKVEAINHLRIAAFYKLLASEGGGIDNFEEKDELKYSSTFPEILAEISKTKCEEIEDQATGELGPGVN